MPDLIEVQRTNIEMYSIGTIPIIALKSTPLDGWGAIYKRTADFSIALLLLVLI